MKLTAILLQDCIVRTLEWQIPDMLDRWHDIMTIVSLPPEVGLGKWLRLGVKVKTQNPEEVVKTIIGEFLLVRTVFRRL